MLGLIDGVTGSSSQQPGIPLLGALYTSAVLIPGVAVAVRRLHDTGRAGWWLLIGVVPLIGVIVLLVFMVQDSHLGENQHGPNPKVYGT